MLKTLEDLIKTIRERKSSSDDSSYTSKLLKDKDLSLEKVKEEISELIEAVENNSIKFMSSRCSLSFISLSRRKWRPY